MVGSSVHCKRDVERRHLLGLATGREITLRRVDRVDDAYEIHVRSVVVGVKDRLIEFLVVAGLVLPGRLPFALDVALFLEAVEGGLERALSDFQRVARELLDALADAPAMHRGEREGFQDEEVEGSLEDIGG